MHKKITSHLIALLLAITSSTAIFANMTYRPDKEITKEFKIDLRDNFRTMEKISEDMSVGTVSAVKDAGFGKVLRLKSTKDIGDNTYVVGEYNYRKDDLDKVPTLIVVAGKPNLEDSFGKTQNGAVTLDTRNGIPALKNELQFLFIGFVGDFAKQIAAARNGIYQYMKDNDLAFFGKEEAKVLAEKWSEKKIAFAKLNELISSFVANANARAFAHDGASFVITQIWKEEHRPYGNPNNLGIMYVVPPEKSKTITDAKTWLNLIYDTGRSVVVNALNVLKDQDLEKVAVQVHLPGAGKFLFAGVSQTEANAVFVEGLVEAIREIKKGENADLADKLELYFAFTPHYFKSHLKRQKAR